MTTSTDDKYLISEKALQLSQGPEWLQKQRSGLGQSFNENDLPRRGLHLWRYTDPTRFLLDQRSEPTAIENLTPLRVETQLLQQFETGDLAGVVIDRGGRSVESYLSPAAAEAGVKISGLTEAAKDNAAVVQNNLYQLIGAKTGKFEAMNGALWHEGVCVVIPDGVSLDRPIHLLRQAGPAGTAVFPRLLVVAGNNSEVAIVDEYAGGSDNYSSGQSYSNGAVEIFAGDDSRLRYVTLQRYGAGTDAYLTHRARLGQNATMLTVPLSFGGLLAKSNFGVILNGPGAESNISGLVFGSQRQHYDNHTLHHHTADNTHSDINFKVVLGGRAESAYTGLIRIENDAKTCEAFQENRNLLLTKGTKAESIPELEILNEDVQCSHGATVGPIDPLAIFYLSSRGIGYDEAVRIIVSGFVNTTLARLPGDLQDRVRGYVAERLEQI